MKKKEAIISYGGICLVAAVLALAYQLFVFPNAFAPAGLNGLITMIQSLFHINIGYLSLLVNIPLLAFAWKSIGRSFSVRTLVYVLVFSLANLWLGSVDLSAYVYHTYNGTSLLLGPVAAGVISGLSSGYSHLLGGSTGGMEVASAYIQVKDNTADFSRITFALNSAVAILSYFVYGNQMEPVLLCLVYCFTSARVCDIILRGQKESIRLEVVCDHAEQIAHELMQKLHHGVTVIQARGMYSGQEKELLICIVEPSQISQLYKILSQYPVAFSYVSSVRQTIGNFKRSREMNRKAVQ